jgi:hypothetical protein
MATKALGYGRVSTVKQVADGVSLEAQRIEITSFAIASGYGLLDVLCDDGISGSKDEEGVRRLGSYSRLSVPVRCPLSSSASAIGSHVIRRRPLPRAKDQERRVHMLRDNVRVDEDARRYPPITIILASRRRDGGRESSMGLVTSSRQSLRRILQC